MPREIIVDWTGPGSSPHLSVFNFETAGSAAAQRAALAAFLGAADAFLCNLFTWTIRTEGRVMLDTSGEVIAFWSDNTPYTGTGGVNTAQVPDVAQLLVRWRTDEVVNGRRLMGRTFLPGAPTNAVIAGNVAPATVAGVQTAAQAFVADADGPAVWHRPVAGSGGLTREAVSATVWNEFASLRKRRG